MNKEEIDNVVSEMTNDQIEYLQGQFFRVAAKCQNCLTYHKLTLKKGTSVVTVACPNCGCVCLDPSDPMDPRR